MMLVLKKFNYDDYLLFEHMIDAMFIMLENSATGEKTLRSPGD